MYFLNYADYFNDDFFYRANPVLSYSRFFHASPDAPPVDVYVNGLLVGRDIGYQDFSEYLPLPSGAYQITIFPTGKKVNPVINTRISIPSGKIFTIAVINRLQNIELLPIDDTFDIANKGKAYVRFGHLSPNTPNVDISTPDGKILFRNIGYKGITEYIPLNPGVYTIEARPTGEAKPILYVPNIAVRPGKAYTIYAVGLLNMQPPLQVVIPLDGSSYIKF